MKLLYFVGGVGIQPCQNERFSIIFSTDVKKPTVGSRFLQNT